ncbi:MAG: nuclear transport factor 2 family protein [Pseudomonadota bacterium]
MSSYEAMKALVKDHHGDIAAATAETVEAHLARATSDNWHWRGMHPWNEQHGASGVAAAFWRPFLTAFRSVQRREDMFFAGLNQIDDYQSTWVVSMGHLMGLFDAPFLGIPPTRKIAMLRYAEFNRVEGGEITETAFFVDVLHLMTQAGLNPVPEQTAQFLIQPGPMTHDGLQFEDAPAAEGPKTLELINRMIGDINNHQVYASPQEELAQCWHDDMLWWGPEGIGATYTIDRYIEQHQAPFRRNVADRVFNGHLAKLAEGNYGGFFGWPNLSLTMKDGYMGMSKDGAVADMRVIDLYRRDGDKLAENWIFIDMLHFLKMQGIDILEDLQSA